MSDALIPADVRSRLQDLRLNSRRAIGARGIGLHRSRSRGAGLEFAQYRAYEPGDEPRQIDWKLYARSDRFFVREAERESPLTAWLLVDAMNRCWTAPLVEAIAGGSHERGARVTPFGEEVLRLYRAMISTAEHQAGADFSGGLSALLATTPRPSQHSP